MSKRDAAEAKMYEVRGELQVVRAAAAEALDNRDERRTFVTGRDRSAMVKIATEGAELEQWFQTFGPRLLEVTQMTGDEEEDGIEEMMQSVGALVSVGGLCTCQQLLEEMERQVADYKNTQSIILGRLGTPIQQRIREQQARKKKQELAAKGCCLLINRLIK